MKKVYMKELPACCNCNKSAQYDAPMIQGSWGYFCKTCGLRYCNLKMATELVQREGNTRNKDAKPILGIDTYDLETLMMEDHREIKCPSCQEERRLELDASGSFTCNGCGQKVLISELPF